MSAATRASERDSRASNVDQLEAASMKLMHAEAMADVMHDFDFRDLPGETLQAYVHGLRAVIDAAKEMVDEAASAAMRDSAVFAHSPTTGHDDLARAAVNATFEISSLGDRIRAEVGSNGPRQDEGIVIQSHARRITQLSDALMTFLGDGITDGLVEAGLMVAAAAGSHSSQVSQ